MTDITDNEIAAILEVVTVREEPAQTPSYRDIAAMVELADLDLPEIGEDEIDALCRPSRGAIDSPAAFEPSDSASADRLDRELWRP